MQAMQTPVMSNPKQFTPRPLSQQSKRTLCIAEARKLATEKKYKEALAALEPLLKKGKPGAEVLYIAAAVWEAVGNHMQATAFALRSLSQREHPDTLLLLQRGMMIQGETEKSIAYGDRVLALRPGDKTALLIKGSALESAGRFDEARQIIEPLVREVREAGGQLDRRLAMTWGKILVQFKEHAEAVEALGATADDEQTPDPMRVEVLHVLAKAHDRSKQYPLAYTAAGRANKIGELEFDPELYDEQVSILMDNWSRGQMSNFPVSKCESAVPVFVAGMPRSGTSLIDQIIDAHPRAAGVGELDTIGQFARELAAGWNSDLDAPECFGRMDDGRWTRAAERYLREIRKLAPGAERIVNKSLGNNRMVGLIARLFPNTRIIHAIRDPRDVSVSCYMGGFNNALHPWTTRMEWVARAWDQSMRMMDHWKNTLDVPILDVHYERLVNDPAREFPRIIEFLGLDWDEACNDFHKSRRTVRTLSYDQVNRPLYKSSAGRHSNYAEFLEGINFPGYDPFAEVDGPA